MANFDIGTIKRGKDIGYKSYDKFTWLACPDCGKERWVILGKSRPLNPRCHKCANKVMSGEGHPNWKGGKHNSKEGYILVKVQPDSLFYPMAESNGYIREHRLVMAQHLGRCLLRQECVHHIDGIKSNNAFSNLKILSPASHRLNESMCKNCELKKEIRLLRWQIKELQAALQEKMRIWGVRNEFI